ncbi:tetratricopeptide protein [Algibacter lectus]|uniref:Tetratricopeptide protein n=1 Tax=Algibacter lectus TaxID=221126 RepID=A0A090WPU3_9FLAO|nr:tetratricopeptide repeat protein [Algibacter lectus]GAL78991.1 tetratricopeptide protein [Algibacter lectus]
MGGYELKYDYNNAIKFYKKALEEAVLDADKAWALAQIGMQYMDLNKYREAKRYYKLSLNIYENIEEKSESDLIDMAAIYTDLGIIERYNGVYAKAIINHEKALVIREELLLINHDKYILNLSMSYNNLAVVYKNQGLLNESIDYNERVVKIRRELVSKSNEAFEVFLLARSLSNLGNVYYSKGENLKASHGSYLKYYHSCKDSIEEAIDLILTLEGKINEVEYKENISSFYVNYGRVLHSLKEYEFSIRFLENAITNYKKLININRDKYIGGVI